MVSMNNSNGFDSKVFHEYSSTVLYLLSVVSDEEHKDFIRELFSIVSSSSDEIFSIINSSIRLNKTIKKEIDRELTSTRIKIEQVLEDNQSFSEEYYQAVISRYVSTRDDTLQFMDKEIEMQSSGFIVLLLSLLESILYEFIIKLMKFNNKLPDIKTVLKRDKGIAKYLKYFEKYVSEEEGYYIVGEKIYSDLLVWADLRNNIVHNSNKYNDDLFKKAKKINIAVDINNYSEKFKYSTRTVVQIGILVCEILYICIKEYFYKMFNVEFLEVNGYYPPIIIE